jgi:isoquinoline 1-oxidoreductase subunit beta
MTTAVSRRALLKGGLAVGAGLSIGFPLARAGRPAGAQAKAFRPNAWVNIDRDGVVTIITGQSEMGQGTLTTIGMIIADELDADWSTVKIQQGGADRVLGNPNFMGGSQATVGSRSIRDFLGTWRRAGAAGREMLAAAAARKWSVPLDEVYPDQGVVYHRPTGRKFTYGELVDEASQLPVPQNPRLKTRDQFKLIGKNVPRRDTPDKVTGRAIFGMDVVVPGMLVATVQRCPVFGGKVKSLDAGPAKAVKGVRDVVVVSAGVAVVADGYWAAKRGRDALRIEWDEGPNASLTSAEISRGYAQLAQQPGKVARRDGDPAKALGEADKRVEAVYEVPFLAHATMEPMNCTAHVQADRCDVWVPTQGQTAAQARAAEVSGLPPERVFIHTTFLGGGFGRRFETDFVADAVEVSKAVKAPVKVIWSREDDMQHGFYRPATYNVLRGGLDGSGGPVGWTHRIVSPSLLIPRKWPLPPNGVDPAMMAIAADLPYTLPNLQVDWVFKDFGVPVGFWRSVSSSQNAFITESFVDELAHTAGKDPFEYRRALLGRSGKHKGVLEMAAKQAGWGTPLPPGRARGIAVAFAYGSYAAEVAEVSVGADGRVRVHRVVCAVDTGFAANPDQIRAQMEGGIVYALTAVLYGEITIDKGRVVQSNFHDYPMLRIDETPRIEVHVMESGDFVGGAGEPGVPPLAPAVCNAIFTLTGKRVRRLPIDRNELRRA